MATGQIALSLRGFATGQRYATWLKRKIWPSLRGTHFCFLGSVTQMAVG